MTAVRRFTSLVGVALLASIGVLLILESAEVITSGWRKNLASGIGDLASPSWSPWISALVGAGLGIVGIALIAAQIAPPKKGLRTVHEVYKGNDGSTMLRGRAAIGAVRHELNQIDGVVDVDARIARKQLNVEVNIDDSANLARIENDARNRLDHEFWINLGLADLALNLLVAHHRNPTRVR